MFDTDRHVRVIRELIDRGDPASLTYAALECRLALEAICYERLRHNHKHLSGADIRKWQPSQVINQLMQEVEPHVAMAFTLEVARGAPKDVSAEGYEELEWVPLGEQSALPVRQISKLWNALSKLALHVRLPQSHEDRISVYADPLDLAPKLNEAVQLLQEIAKGNLLGGTFGPDRVFECSCGRKIRRREAVLQESRLVSCPNPECEESYVSMKNGEEYVFERRVAFFNCPACQAKFGIPARKLDVLTREQRKQVSCSNCGFWLELGWGIWARPLGDEASGQDAPEAPQDQSDE